MQSTLPRAFPWLIWLYFLRWGFGGRLLFQVSSRREERLIWVEGVLGKEGRERIVDSEHGHTL